MSATDEIRAHLNHAQLDIAEALALLPASSVIAVGPADNLLSVLADAPAGAILSIDPAFMLEADVALSKPVTLLNALDPGPLRVTSQLRGPVLRGALTSLAPDVSLIGLRLEGKVKESTIVTTGPRMTVDRCLVLGTSDGQHRGIRADSDTVDIRQCSIGNIWASQDAQAIAAWDGCKHLTVDDCYLEASGENVLFGGADSASAANIPQDIAITNCTLFKPLEWIGKAGLTAKNLFEAKCVQRLSVVGCHMENSWVSGQTGYALVLTVRNQGGLAPWSVIEDATVEDCTFTNSVSGIQILGQDDSHVSGVMDRVTLRRLAFTHIGATWPGGVAGGRQMLLAGGSRHLTLDHLTFAGVIEPEGTAMTFDGPGKLHEALTVTDCWMLEGAYGIHGTDAPSLGQAVLEMYAPGYVWERNTIVRGASGRAIAYPPGTTVI